MEINYGDTVETIRDERGVVVGFDDALNVVIVRVSPTCVAHVERKFIVMVIHNQD